MRQTAAQTTQTLTAHVHVFFKELAISRRAIARVGIVAFAAMPVFVLVHLYFVVIIANVVVVVVCQGVAVFEFVRVT